MRLYQRATGRDDALAPNEGFRRNGDQRLGKRCAHDRAGYGSCWVSPLALSRNHYPSFVS